MKVRNSNTPIPNPVVRVRVADSSIRIEGVAHEVVLTFHGPEHVERFLSKLAEAWLDWDSDEDYRPLAAPQLQQTLPF